MSKNKGHRVRPIQAAFVRTLVSTSVGTNAMLASTLNLADTRFKYQIKRKICDFSTYCLANAR